MTLLERLQNHRGGLLRIESQLYWYGGRGWDGVPGRICLVLEANADEAARARVAATATAAAAASTALLLVDGSPHWVWVAEADVEILDGGDR